MSLITTHVLDAQRGAPAQGLAVVLTDAAGGVLGRGETDGDGRAAVGPEELPAGSYRLTFATGEWFATLGAPAFYPEVVVTFAVEAAAHYHVPVLLSPYSYTTYLGS